VAIQTGGEVVAITSELGWAERLLCFQLGAGSAGMKADPAEPQASAAGRATVRVHIEAVAKPFGTIGMRVITRGAYAGAGHVVMVNAGGSGFDVRVSCDSTVLDVVARYRPPLKERMANTALGERFGLLASQILVHYPVLWRAGWRGRVPLHASVLRTEAGTPLFAGPGGVGKSRLVRSAMSAGAVATADNLCCADAGECFGIAEPLRMHDVDAGPQRLGGRTSNGRVLAPFGRREPVLAPDRLVVLERAATIATTVTEIDPVDAARALVAGTYAAGELRRYWAFAATLALATARGPAHPPITDVATALAARVPCLRIRVGDGDRISPEQIGGIAGGISAMDELTRHETTRKELAP
jgi:hypothetical protein